MNHIDALRKVVTHNISRLNATMDYDRVTDSIIVLANTIANSETDENTWYLGECDEFTLDSLLVGAYWHYTEWHGRAQTSGQSSKGYVALSTLCQVFDPGMSSLDDESGEKYVYDLLAEMATRD